MIRKLYIYDNYLYSCQIIVNRLLSARYCWCMADGEKLTNLQHLQMLVFMQASGLAIHITICHAQEKQLHAENEAWESLEKKVPTWNIYGNDFLRIPNVPESK